MMCTYAWVTNKDEVFRTIHALLCGLPRNLPVVSYHHHRQVEAERMMDLHYLEMNFLTFKSY
jgi:hypothetical protein